MGLQYKVKFENIDEFYKESNLLEDTGNKEEFLEQSTRNQPNFVGLPLQKILESKYSYKEGLDKLKELDLDLNLGSNKSKYKWDADDGDDMSMERMYEGQACLSKRVRNEGNNTGKFVTLSINIGVNAFVDADAMLMKAYTAIQIADYLESRGYKITIEVYSHVLGLGCYKGEYLESLTTSIIVKKPEDPLIKSQLLTTISPWMFRHHIFKFWCAKFEVSYGLGSSRDVETLFDTKDRIIISSMECLNKKGVEQKLKSLKKLFDTDDIE